jgi:phosphopantetheinyl transferase
MTRLYFTEIPRLADRRAMRVAERRAGRALLRHVLGCGEEDLRLCGNGKPYLPGGPHFSLSHSGGLVLLAVSELGEVGCDVEDAARPAKNPEAIRAKITRLGEEGAPLLALWVRREAEYKAGGPGTVFYPAMPEGYIAAVCCTAEEDVGHAQYVPAHLGGDFPGGHRA